MRFFSFVLFTLILFPVSSQVPSSAELLKRRFIERDRKRDSIEHLAKIALHDSTKLKLYASLTNYTEVSLDNLPIAEKLLGITEQALRSKPDTGLLRFYRNFRVIGFELMAAYYGEKEGQGSVKVLQNLQNALAVAEDNGDQIRIAGVRIAIANYYYETGNVMKQLAFLRGGLRMAEASGNKLALSNYYLEILNVYARQGDTARALAFIEKSQTIEREIGDSARLARTYYSFGSIYKDLKFHDKSLEYYFRSLALYEKMGDLERQYNLLLSLGTEYLQKKEYLKALEYSQKCLSMAETKGDIQYMFFCIVFSGKVYESKGDFEKAIALHTRALQIANESKIEAPINLANSHLAEDYFKKGNFKKAKLHLDLCLPSIKKQRSINEIHDLMGLAYRIDSANGNYREAFPKYVEYKRLGEQLNDVELKKASVREKLQADFEMRNLADKAEQTKKETLFQEERKRQRLILYSVCAGLILVLTLVIFIFRGYRQKQRSNLELAIKNDEISEQKRLVEEKQKEILDSINYAKRLQEAILPPQEFIQDQTLENFILYQPKDVVAGDFYWAEKQNDLLLIAAADSTGHGVPGAMVSVVCSNALNRTVKEFKVLEPGKILDKTRELVVETFAKSASDVKDGMDISLLAIDKTKKKIFWSGANNPLWYIENGKLTELTADKQAVGKTEDPKPFTTHTIEYKKGTVFYLFTDGLADQFGGPKGKKFKYKQFEELLLGVYKLPTNEQGLMIQQAFNAWKGSLEQVDDVCVIGLRLG